MSDGNRYLVAGVFIVVGAAAVATYFGVITWGDTLLCALVGQAAFGPMCVQPWALMGIAFVSLLVAWTAWPSRAKASGSS